MRIQQVNSFLVEMDLEAQALRKLHYNYIVLAKLLTKKNVASTKEPSVPPHALLIQLQAVISLL